MLLWYVCHIDGVMVSITWNYSTAGMWNTTSQDVSRYGIYGVMGYIGNGHLLNSQTKWEWRFGDIWSTPCNFGNEAVDTIHSLGMTPFGGGI